MRIPCTTTQHFSLRLDDPDPAYYAYRLGRVSRTQDGTAYYHADAHGSTGVLTDGNGAAAQSYIYDAWGNQAGQPSEANDYRYCGQWDYSTHENTVWQTSAWGYRTGLMHLGCRFYDAELGRFIQPDPLLGSAYNPQSLNRYTYCLNSPLNGVDPTGEGFWGDVWDWIKARGRGAVTGFTIRYTIGLPIALFGNLWCTVGQNVGERTAELGEEGVPDYYDRITNPLPVGPPSDGGSPGGGDGGGGLVGVPGSMTEDPGDELRDLVGAVRPWRPGD